MAYCVDRVGGSGAPDFGLRDHEVAIAAGRDSDHLQAMIHWGDPALRLVRRRRSRNEINQVERQRLAVLFRCAQMAEVDRIEAAAEQPYAHRDISPARTASACAISPPHFRIWPSPRMTYL